MGSGRREFWQQQDTVFLPLHCHRVMVPSWHSGDALLQGGRGRCDRGPWECALGPLPADLPTLKLVLSCVVCSLNRGWFGFLTSTIYTAPPGSGGRDIKTPPKGWELDSRKKGHSKATSLSDRLLLGKPGLPCSQGVGYVTPSWLRSLRRACRRWAPG